MSLHQVYQEYLKFDSIDRHLDNKISAFVISHPLFINLQSLPLKRGLPPSISAKIQPTDHKSTNKFILANNFWDEKIYLLALV